MQGFLQLTLPALFIFASLAYGAVHNWAYSLVYGITFLLAAAVLVRAGIYSVRGASTGDRTPSRVVVWQTAGSGWFYVPALVFILFILFQLTPLPGTVLQVLSPQTARLYHEAHTLTVVADDVASSASLGYLTLDRDKTVKSLLAFSAYVTFAFLLMASLRRTRDLRRFVAVLVAFCAGLSLYGLLRMLLDSPQIWGWENPRGSDRVSATLINPDHFADYLIMAIYLTFGYFLAILKNLPPAKGKTAFRRWLNLLQAEHSAVPKLFLLLFAIAITVSTLIYTLSRGGIGGFCLSMGFCLLLFFLRTRKPVYLCLFVIVGLLVAYYIQVVGVDPLLERIEQTQRELAAFDQKGGRLQFHRMGLELWRKFPWLGSGLGTVPIIFPMVQSDWTWAYIFHVHNDWLQLAIEVGWVGLALFCLLFGFVFLRILGLWWRTNEPWGFGLGLAALGSMLAMAIHGFLDFGLRVPCNALFLVIQVTLGWIALTRYQLRHEPVSAKSAAGNRFLLAGAACLSVAAVFLLLTVQITRYALAQYYCRTEVDMVNRIQGQIDLAAVARAAALNPLKSEYWLLLAAFAAVPEPSDLPSGGGEGEPQAPREAPALIGGVTAGGAPEETAYRKALLLSPGRADCWLLWAEYLRSKLETGEIDHDDAVGKTARSLDIAIELSPENLLIREQAVDFFLWRWSVLNEEGASDAQVAAEVLQPLAGILPLLMARQRGYQDRLAGQLKQNNLPEFKLRQVLREKATSN